MYVIEKGKVEISQMVGCRKVVITILEEGDFFGEMSMFSDEPRSATATAMGRTTLLSLSSREILQHIQVDYQFALVMLQALIGRLHKTTNSMVFLKYLISSIYSHDEGSAGAIDSGYSLPRIGEIIVKLGYVTGTQLERFLWIQEAMDIAGDGHKLLGEIMMESGLLTPDQLSGALEMQRHMPGYSGGS
jgi:hypothetical protein